VKFQWEFWRQSCTNLQEEVIFGQIRFLSLRVELGSMPNSDEGLTASLRLSVRTGAHFWERWQTKRVRAASGVASWPDDDRWLQVWHFVQTPLITIEVERGSLLAAPAGVHGMAFFCLPREAKREELVLPVERFHVAGGMAEAWEHADLVDSAVLVRYQWSRQQQQEDDMNMNDIDEFQCEDEEPQEFEGSLRMEHAIWMKGEDTTRKVKLRILVQSSAPDDHDHGDIVIVQPSRSGRIDSTVQIHWRRCEEHHVAVENFFKETEEDDVNALAKRMQYVGWSFSKIFHSTFKRDYPLLGLLRYAPLMTRKQRYAILSSVLLFAAFITVFLFRDDCAQTPKPKSCTKAPVIELFFSWQVIFGSIWGLILSVPLPFLLLMLFKKRVILTKMTDEEKEWTLRAWLWRERLGWAVVVLVQVVSIFFLLSFVRYYPWTVIEKWLLATFQSVFHRLISAPGIRMLWVAFLMVISRYTSLFDCFLVMQPTLTTFQASPGQSGLHGKRTQQGQEDNSDTEEEEAQDGGEDMGDLS